MFFIILAIFFSGVLFGAMYYIAAVRQSVLNTQGVVFNCKFLALHKEKAIPFNETLSFIASISGVGCWFVTDLFLWLVGAFALLLVFIVNVYLISPIEKRILVRYKANKQDNQTDLIRQWSMEQWLCAAISGISFIVYIYAGLIK